MKQKFFILIFILISMSCKTVDVNRPESIEKYKLTVNAADSMVIDIINIIRENFTPQKDEFLFIHKNKPFGLRLEHHLRKEGYAVLKDTALKGDQLWVSYKIDSVIANENEIDRVILLLYIGQRFQLNRLYIETDGLMITEDNQTYTIFK